MAEDGGATADDKARRRLLAGCQHQTMIIALGSVIPGVAESSAEDLQRAAGDRRGTVSVIRGNGPLSLITPQPRRQTHFPAAGWSPHGLLPSSPRERPPNQ
jgi:hypothetical protein